MLTAEGTTAPLTARCGVVGSPVSRSLSPVMHRAAYEALGLEWTYEAVDVPTGGLRGFLAGTGGRWRGVSVTMPLKRDALALAGRASAIARAVGAANTLLSDGAGGWRADNTDVSGLVEALRAGGAEHPADVVVVGGGATAASALVALAQLAPAAHVQLRARSAERAEPTLAVGRSQGLAISFRPWADEPHTDDQADLVISTVPNEALAPADRERVTISGGEGAILFDVVYDPWPTPLAEHWRASGRTVIPGLELLLHQAVGQVRWMTGLTVDPDVLRTAAEAEMMRRGAA